MARICLQLNINGEPGERIMLSSLHPLLTFGTQSARAVINLEGLYHDKVCITGLTRLLFSGWRVGSRTTLSSNF